MTDTRPAPIPTALNERYRIIERMRALHAEIAQMFLDTAYWNHIHPDEPIDPDPDGQMARMALALERSIAKAAS